MSVEELIVLARELPRADQIRLIDAISPISTADDEAFLLKHFPPGFSAEVWFPEANGPAAEALGRILDDERAGK